MSGLQEEHSQFQWQGSDRVAYLGFHPSLAALVTNVGVHCSDSYIACIVSMLRARRGLARLQWCVQRSSLR